MVFFMVSPVLVARPPGVEPGALGLKALTRTANERLHQLYTGQTYLQTEIGTISSCLSRWVLGNSHPEHSQNLCSMDLASVLY